MTTSAGINLFIGGAGGFARETIELVRALNASGHSIKLRGVLDDDDRLVGTSLLGVSIVGALDTIHEYADSLLTLTIGNPTNYGVRQLLTDRLGLDDDRYATLTHPTVSQGQSVTIGPGSILHAQCVLTADVKVGRHVVVMPQVVLTHDNVIDDFCTIASGATLGGGVHAQVGAYVGAGALIKEGVTIGAGSMIGFGSVVTRDVPPGETWFGVPASRKR